MATKSSLATILLVTKSRFDCTLKSHPSSFPELLQSSPETGNLTRRRVDNFPENSGNQQPP